MATYNGEKYLKRQLESILDQLGEGDEVVISDDSSFDDTISIIEWFDDPRIRLLKHNHFHSPIFNLENAVRHAKGDYIFLSDQDDIWHSRKIAVMTHYLKDHTTVVSDCVLIDEDDNLIAPSFYQLNGSRPGLTYNLLNNSYLGCCMAFNRKILHAAIPFPRSIAMHDIWIGLLTELIGKPVFIPDKLISYRRHAANFSSASEPSRLHLWFKLKYRLQFVWLATARLIKLNLNPNLIHASP
ncbi:MAG: glycosyltransferase family 2 protein [Prolixibacteraceae bacterium]